MKRFLAVMLTGLVLTACSGTSSEEHLDNAKASLERGDRTAALIELKNSLQQDPANAEARWLLGKAYFEIGEFESAGKELDQALAAGISQTAIAPLQAQLLLVTGEYDRLTALPAEGLDPADRATVQAAKGLGIMAQGNTLLASDLIEEALQNDPVSPYALVAGAKLAMEEQLVSTARERVDQALVLAPTYAPAWRLLGDIESLEENIELASEAYAKAIEVGANTFNDRLKFAMSLIYLLDFEAAQKELDDLKKQSPENPGVNFAQGLIYLQEKNLEEAKSSFETASLYSGGSAFSLYYLAAINLEEGNEFIARQNIIQFLAVVPDNTRGLMLAAGLDLKEGDFQGAEEKLKTVIARDPENVVALNLLAKVFIGEGKNEEAIQLLKQVAELQPDSPEAQTNLGVGFLAVGEQRLGMETLQATLKLDPEYEKVDVQIVLGYLRERDFDGAIKAAKDYRERNPGNSAPDSLLGLVYLAAGKEEESKAAFAAALAIAPGNPEAGHGLAEIALQQEDYDTARKYYQDVLEYNPDNLQTLMKLAASYALEGKPEQMVEVLERAVKAHPRSVEPRLVLARRYLAAQQPRRAAEVFSELTDEQKTLPDVLEVTVGAELARENYDLALATANQLISIRPGTGHYHYLKARAYAGLGENTRAENELRKAAELQPNHVYARIALSQFLLSSEDTEAFQQSLSTLKADFPNHPAVVKLEIAAANARGDQEYAAHLMQSLFDENPSTTVLLGLVRQKRVAGDTEGAVALINDWLATHSDDLPATMALGDIYAQSGQLDSARTQYLKVLKLNENSAPALNNLAWILRDSDPREAVQYAERAHELSPESASYLDTLAIAYMKNNDLAKAGQTIEEALAISPDSPGVLLHKAQIQAAAGDKAGAVDTLNALLGSAGQFPGLEEAKALLAQLR